MTFFIDATDTRNQTVKALLKKRKHHVMEEFDIARAKEGDVIIFAPNKKFVNADLENLPNSCTLVCGNIPQTQADILVQKQINHINVLQDEVFAMQNSLLTAEGILADILTNNPKSIFDNKILILGNGRVGKATAALFAKMGLDFSICSHDTKNFALCHLFSQKNYFKNDFLKNLNDFDIIINTIPAEVIPQEMYNSIKKGCLFLEIASVQTIVGDVEFEYKLCPALPQKYSAESAGKVFFECIERMLK